MESRDQAAGMDCEAGCGDAGGQPTSGLQLELWTAADSSCPA